MSQQKIDMWQQIMQNSDTDRNIDQNEEKHGSNVYNSITNHHEALHNVT